ncbi:MAG: alpha/beta fold hydrolase [Betaproteobacteria bacterium]
MRSPLPAPTGIPYVSPLWLPGGHAQTIYPVLLPNPKVTYRRERIETPDGDFWLFDWLDSPPPRIDVPVVVVFHGLEGSSRSHYALALMARLAALGWRGVVAHFRGCGGEANLRPRAYHSGDHAEIGAMLGAVRARVDPATTVFAFGISLGGSALLNWVGRAGADAARTISAAAAASTPLDLMASGISIDEGINRLVYVKMFLHSLKPKALAMEKRFPGMCDARRVAQATTLWQFDDAFTAPVHGFAGADDYWTRASSKPWLRDVMLPTLVINARNDPFVPAASLPHAAQVSSAVILEQPDHGGHAGFATPPVPGRIQWLAQRVTTFFEKGE